MIYNNVQEKLLSGAKKLSDVVSSTMGPGGHNVIINRLSDSPNITKDGVTVARNVYLEDVVENIAVRLIKEASMNVVKEAGDGTTTATLLTYEFFRVGKELVEELGYSPNEVKCYFNRLKDQVIGILKEKRILIDESNRDLLRKVATISANNDVELGNTIYEAIETVGFDGAIKVLASRNSQTFVEKVEGVCYNNGYVSPYFVNNATNRKTEFDRPTAIYLFDKKLESVNEIEHILKLNYNNPVLFICADYSPEALSMLVINKQRGRELCAVRAAEFGDYRKAVFEDLAVMTNATIITALVPFRNENDARTYAGIASKVIVTKNDHTLFLHPEVVFNTLETKTKHVEMLKELHRNTTIEFDKEKVKDRISKLTTGVANIYVGARTELELGEKVDRVEDALLATQAATEEGVVVGSGLALIKAFNMIDRSNNVAGSDDCVLSEAFEEVMVSCYAKILENCYKDPYDLGRPYHYNDPFFEGYDLSSDSGDIVDLLEVGVIDPFKVTRVALENSFSIAMMLLTADNVVEHFDKGNPYLGEIDE